ncbi:telomerase-binding protein EST1A isoform X2 [Cephus cinctus]|uniref:Telomerase-binding protein EST1A isoform X2 n=1 Tax=Cephus cinctus TaxID=211228 RepID=A0AAJ7BSI4_CEPCN|nr:telomerase-binding protein EST1A isoform X2 [Cephus cinctus]
MANHDKGRRKWGGISQDIRTDSKFDISRSAGMRGGGNRAPPQAIYRPGSGPLRKSGRSNEDFDNENNAQDRPKPSSIQYRLKQSQFNSPNQIQNSPPSSQIDDITTKLNDVHVNYRNNSNNDQTQGSSKNNQMGGDSRKKNKKPEQQLYVPKKVKEALAGRDVSNRSPTHGTWDRDRDDKDWDTQSNRSHRSESHRHHRSGGHSGSHSEAASRRDDHGKRYSGNRRNRNASENDERWRSDSPSAARNFGNRRDNPREVRQGSEPLFETPLNTNDPNRKRDTRSVEPTGHPDKFQGKPPSGRRGSVKEGCTTNSMKHLDLLPLRLRKKFIEDGTGSIGITAIGTSSEDTWDGSTVTFQGSSAYHYPPAMQHSQTMQNLPPTGPLPPQQCWSNTVPARSRGRGRLRPEEIESPAPIFRPVTPDQYSAPSTRSHTPSQDYMNRSYDRRGSSSTMYTSMESLSRADSILMPPPPAVSPSTTVTNSNRCQPSPDNHQEGVSLPSASQQQTYQTQRVNNNSYDAISTTEKSNNQQTLNLSPTKSEPFSPIPNLSSEQPLDWCEEVELNEKLEAEHMSRSSSMMSLRENASVSGNQPPIGGSVGRQSNRKKKRNRRYGGDRNSRDKVRENSCERQNNQHNRENDNYNNNQKNTNSNRRYDRRHRNIIHRSRESSKDRNYRTGYRNTDDFHRNRVTDHTEENWRSGRKTSICESEDGRRTPCQPINTVHPSNTVNQPNTSTNLATKQTSPTSCSNAQPGVLVLPENSSHSPPSVTPPRQLTASQQQRTLFDPNNPNKPIIVTSTGNRASVQHRENEVPAQVSSVPIFPSHSGITSNNHNFQLPQLDTAPPPYNPDQFGNMRPSWYDVSSESFRAARNNRILVDIEHADLELQWIFTSGKFMTQWESVCKNRNCLQNSLRSLLETDIKFCEAENVEQHIWKILFYNIIELLRKGMPKENSVERDCYKKIMLGVIDEGTAYLESLLIVLENTYKIKLDTYLGSSAPTKGLGIRGLALISAHKIFLFLGDLARYKEQANETNNYGKSRQWYLKAQQINPKNGRPYNQLALLAHYAKRKLDAVYYYMRSLMASNPFRSARESLIALFDENRKKYLHYYESTERKRKEEREWKERARMKEKEGASSSGGGLRRETWIHPGGRRVRRTTSAATANEARLAQSDLEEFAELTSVEVNKRFITSYLHVHGKLFTKIGMETFQEAGIQMLKEFRALLQHSPLPLQGTRLLQLLALNMFAIDSTQLKDSQLEQGYRSEVQERALVVSLQMFNLILERVVSLLKSQLDNDEKPNLIVGEDMQVLLPSIKIWCDWMLCNSTIWNPPPSCTDYRVGPPGDAWSRLATTVNLLEKLPYPRNVLVTPKNDKDISDDLELLRLPEDTTLSGFTPLMSNLQDPVYYRKNEDLELAQVCLRINKILFFGQVFLCGLETPVLKLQKSETGVSEYVSVVEASSASSPSSPPEQSDSELLVESYSEDEDESSNNLRRRSSSTLVRNEVTEESSLTPSTPGDIRSLLERKEELERCQRKQDHHRQRVQAILQKSSVSVEIEVRPRQLVPDTNCFIDYLPQLQLIAKATSGAQPIYTLMVPLVVLNELEGLARGGGSRDCPRASSRSTLDPEHVARVADNARNALAFARSRNPAVRCLTTRGTVLTSSTFTVEEDVDQDGLTRNDDRILATCLSLCRAGSCKDQATAEEGQPKRLRREVVLLTEDRNLRVKALARDVPVREVPDFMQWAGLG